MRTDTIALRAIRNLMAGATPFELDVGAVKVACTTTPIPPEPWPAGIEDLVKADGPWPGGVAVDCRWVEGACRFIVEIDRWTRGKYLDHLVVRVRTEQHRQVIFVNVSNVLADVEDGELVALRVRFYLTKRKTHISEEIAEALHKGMRDTLAEAQIPILGRSAAELCTVEVPSGALQPSAEVAFRRLIELALRKLDFIDRRRTVDRGKPLVDLARWLTPDQIRAAGPGDEDAEDELDEDAASSSVDDAYAVDGLPLNLILYGPPGTGKTYALTQDYLKYFQHASTKTDADAEIAEDFTWPQVTAVALHELGGAARVAALQKHPLVKAKYAATPGKAKLSERLWATLQSHTIENSATVRYKSRAGEQWFDKREDSTWELKTPLPEELREIVEQRKLATHTTLDDFTFVTFHQAYGYEDFIEGIRPKVEISGDDDSAALSYTLEDGAFMKAVRAALRLAGYDGSLHDFCGLPSLERARQFDGAPHYAVFIDEINRGNVARIFGELITLLEDDKRLGERHEVIVQLPYSKKRFGVPPNLHVIGTMNTADRSIEALDTALRRRFEFRELAPRPELLDFKIEGDIDPCEMLYAINHRLEKLYDRDHCIGHAYLYALRNDPTLDRLKHVFRNKLIPLLQEYFFGDWGKIGLVLGKDFVRKREASGRPFAAFDHDDYEALAERTSWELADIDRLSAAAFQRIYQ